MSASTHLLCNGCYAKRYPERDPHRTALRAWLPCCACETLTNSGIYVQAEPESVKCNGEGMVHSDSSGEAVPA